MLQVVARGRGCYTPTAGWPTGTVIKPMSRKLTSWPSVSFVAPVLLTLGILPGLALAQGARLGTSCIDKPDVKGAVVERVAPKSPAEMAGIKPGDVIVKLAGKDVTNIDTFIDIFDKLKAGEVVGILLHLQGNAKNEALVDVKLGESTYPADPSEAVAPPEVSRRAGGMVIRRFDSPPGPTAPRRADRPRKDVPEQTPAAPSVAAGKSKEMKGTRPYLGVVTDDSDGRIVVTEVVEGTPAQQAGLREGDVIKQIDGTVIKTQQELRNTLRKLQVGTELNVEIIRNAQMLRLKPVLGAATDEPAGLPGGLVITDPAAALEGEIRAEPTPEAAVRKGEWVQMPSEVPLLRAEISQLRAEIRELRAQIEMLTKMMKK